MRGSLGQPVVVENITGASGTIGVGRVARAAPDGYTLVLGNWATHVLNGPMFSLQYDLVKDFEPVALVSSDPLMIVGKKALPAKDLKEFVAWLKANPDQATQGTTGAGGISTVGGLFFQRETGTRFRFVPYRIGLAAAMQDLVAGQIDFMIDTAANSLPQVRAGTIKAFAVTSKTRLSAAPDIPTVDEAGLPGLYIAVWHGLWAPKGTPKEVIDRMEAELHKAFASEELKNLWNGLGAEVPNLYGDAFGKFVTSETKRWAEVVKSSGAKLDG